MKVISYFILKLTKDKFNKSYLLNSNQQKFDYLQSSLLNLAFTLLN